jgi:hypothetical protein
MDAALERTINHFSISILPRAGLKPIPECENPFRMTPLLRRTKKTSSKCKNPFGVRDYTLPRASEANVDFGLRAILRPGAKGRAGGRPAPPGARPVDLARRNALKKSKSQRPPPQRLRLKFLWN